MNARRPGGRRIAGRWALATATIAVLVGHAADARALTPARLVYVRGEGATTCPDESVVRAAVTERMGRDPFEANATRTMNVELRGASATQFSARIVLSEGPKSIGTRSLVSKGPCSDLVPALALSIAIALDPESALLPPAKEKESAEPPPETPREVAGGPPAIAPPPVRERTPSAPVESLHLEAALAPLVWVAAAPATTLGGSAILALRYKKLSLDFEGRLDVPVERRLATGTVESSLALAMLAPCAHLDGLLLCAVGGVGSFGASSSGVTAPKSDAAFHAVAGVRGGFELPLRSWFAIVARADGLISLTTQRLALDGVEVYSLPRASLGLGIGVRVRFF